MQWMYRVAIWVALPTINWLGFVQGSQGALNLLKFYVFGLQAPLLAFVMLMYMRKDVRVKMHEIDPDHWASKLIGLSISLFCISMCAWHSETAMACVLAVGLGFMSSVESERKKSKALRDAENGGAK